MASYKLKALRDKCIRPLVTKNYIWDAFFWCYFLRTLDRNGEMLWKLDFYFYTYFQFYFYLHFNIYFYISSHFLFFIFYNFIFVFYQYIVLFAITIVIAIAVSLALSVIFALLLGFVIIAGTSKFCYYHNHFIIVFLNKKKFPTDIRHCHHNP